MRAVIDDSATLVKEVTVKVADARFMLTGTGATFEEVTAIVD